MLKQISVIKILNTSKEKNPKLTPKRRLISVHFRVSSYVRKTTVHIKYNKYYTEKNLSLEKD